MNFDEKRLEQVFSWNHVSDDSKWRRCTWLSKGHFIQKTDWNNHFKKVMILQFLLFIHICSTKCLELTHVNTTEMSCYFGIFQLVLKPRKYTVFLSSWFHRAHVLQQLHLFLPVCWHKVQHLTQSQHLKNIFNFESLLNIIRRRSWQW